MQHYCLGFLFTTDHSKMAVVLKNKPKWQAGRYNAIGGKIEEGESAYQSMIREFKEETGLSITNWRKFCILADAKTEVFCVQCFVSFIDSLDGLQTMEEEQISAINVDDLLKMNPSQMLQNLKWLIPMALDKDNLSAVVSENPTSM